MVKWRLVVKTLPWTVLVLGLAYLRRFLFDIPPLVDFDDIGAVLTAAALIIGFMLAGLIGDYKESEKLPGELAATLETSTTPSLPARAHPDGSTRARSASATVPRLTRSWSGS